MINTFCRGLDSLASTQCMELLKSLARDNRTIVCTIHQPSASLYALFDQVYIIAEGMCIYNGASDNTVQFLASVGLQCPMYHNPADYSKFFYEIFLMIIFIVYYICLLHFTRLLNMHCWSMEYFI